MAVYAKYDGVDGSVKTAADADGFAFTADGMRPAEFRPGDWNGDGVVDAADYTVWRNMTGAVPETGGLVSAYPAHEYDFVPGAEADAQGIIAILIGL